MDVDQLYVLCGALLPDTHRDTDHASGTDGWPASGVKYQVLGSDHWSRFYGYRIGFPKWVPVVSVWEGLLGV